MEKLLPITKFVYNNAKTASIGHRPFELNCGDYFYVLFENDVNLHSKSRSVNRLAKELRDLILFCEQSLLHVQELQIQAYHKDVKSHSYIPNEKIRLNSNHIKTKPNRKLEVKFCGHFRVFYLISK